MKKAPLPGRWVRWRHSRYQALAAQGLSSSIAYPIAAAEARWRHRLGRIIGNHAAREAELTCFGRKGQLRFMLSGDLAGLTEEQSEALQELSRRAANAG